MGSVTPPHRCCRVLRTGLPPPHPPLARPCQPPHLARPCQYRPGDDLPPGAEGTDPSGRLVCLIKVATSLAAARAAVQRRQRIQHSAAARVGASRPTAAAQGRGYGTRSSPAADGRAAGDASQSRPAMVLHREHRREARSRGTGRTRPLGASNELRAGTGGAGGACRIG